MTLVLASSSAPASAQGRDGAPADDLALPTDDVSGPRAVSPSPAAVEPSSPNPHGPALQKGGPISPGAANPHAGSGLPFANAGPPQDRSEPSSAVPAKAVEVQVIGVGNADATRARVRLITSFQSIAEGNSDTVQEKSVGADGKVLFQNLDDAIRFNYAVQVEYEGAHYQLPAFRLGKIGQSVKVHVYPSTRDINESFVGMRGFQYLQLREGFFRVDVMYRVMNMSLTTWLPQGVLLQLPPGAEAIDARAKSGDAGFEAKGGAVELVGTFPPGQRDVQFSFQLPNRNQGQVRLEMSLPPHLAELRILAEKTPDMVLDVPGFEAAQPTSAPDGKEVLITGRTMQPGQSEMQSVTIELSGLPTVGPGRWFAVALATLLGGGGLAAAARRQRHDGKKELEQVERARRVLLEEMRLVDRAHREKAIGPRTYEQTKREILLSLARLERITPSADSSKIDK